MGWGNFDAPGRPILSNSLAFPGLETRKTDEVAIRDRRPDTIPG